MEITFDEPDGGEPGVARHESQRTRWIAGVGAAMLIAAAGGVGYGIGRSVAADDSTAPAAAEEVPIAEPDTTDPPPPITTVLLDGSASTSDSDSGSGSADATMSSSGGVGWSIFGGQSMSPVFDRVTDDGYILRAHLGEPWDNSYGPEIDGWQPPPWCYESAQIRVALGGNGVIDVGSVPWYREPYNGRAVSVVGLGVVDGAPRWVVVAQTPPGTTGVTVTFADGSTDTTSPQNDIAVLTVSSQMPAEVDEGGTPYLVNMPPAYEITFDGPTGTIAQDSDAVGNWQDPEFRASCEPPPPALPDAGEQPADPAAAEAEIVAAMTALYDSSVLLDDDAVYLDDATGVGAARDQVAEGSYSTEATSSVAVVEELVFTSPNEAWFRYRIDTDGLGLTNRYGVAVLVDGAWKITRSTLCQDMAMAGGDCGGGWETIRPPGADDMHIEGREILIDD